MNISLHISVISDKFRINFGKNIMNAIGNEYVYAGKQRNGVFPDGINRIDRICSIIGASFLDAGLGD